MRTPTLSLAKSTARIAIPQRSYNFITAIGGMHTTIALQPETHERLLELKRQRRAPSMDALVRALLDDPVPTASRLFKTHEAAIRAICTKYGASRLVAFGSRARGDARPGSDLDLATTLPAGSSLLDQGNMMADLEQVVGMRVDLVTIGPHLGRLLPKLERDGVVLIG
jgi:uncharacterized protein